MGEVKQKKGNSLAKPDSISGFPDSCSLSCCVPMHLLWDCCVFCQFTGALFRKAELLQPLASLPDVVGWGPGILMQD